MVSLSNNISDNHLERNTPKNHRNGSWDRLTHTPADRLAWLWLLVGFVLLPFTLYQSVIWVAAWLAPIFLLRFARTCKKGWIALPLIFITYVFAINFASRGLPFSLLGLLGNVLFKGLVWMLPYTIDRFLARRLQGWSRSLVFPIAFTIVDWLLSILRVSSSGSPAYSQAGNLALLQIISVVGMWGITFLLMWGAAIINHLWEQNFVWRQVRSQITMFVSVLAAVLLFGILRLNGPVSSPQTVEVATITMNGTEAGQVPEFGIDWLNFYQYTEAQRAALRPELGATVDQMTSRTEAALRSGARVVAWQESAAWVLEEDQSDMLERVETLARNYNATLLISVEVFTHATSMPYLYNQSILIDPSGKVLWVYDKTHVVPFDEAFITIGGPGFLPVVDSSYGRLSTAICYDTYYPALLRQAGEKVTDIFYAPTHDISVWASSALAMADYRTIENGFTMIRPTGNGISAVIDNRGRILASQDYSSNSAGLMLAELPVHAGVQTIYSQIGDAFAYLCVAGLVFLTAWALLQRKQPTPIARSQPVVSQEIHHVE
jgi:apolipoprotein N-acyltransferase